MTNTYMPRGLMDRRLPRYLPPGVTAEEEYLSKQDFITCLASTGLTRAEARDAHFKALSWLGTGLDLEWTSPFYGHTGRWA